MGLVLVSTSVSISWVLIGGDVVFQCRDEGPLRANVRWQREGRRIKEGSTDVRGRLEMFKVTVSSMLLTVMIFAIVVVNATAEGDVLGVDSWRSIIRFFCFNILSREIAHDAK